MLGHWRSARGLEPERGDCSVEIFDGADVTARLATEMRQWYLNLLDTAPLRYLTLTDIAAKVHPVVTEIQGLWTAHLPRDVRRTVSLLLEGAPAPAPVLAADRLPGRVYNPYVRGCDAAPRAFAVDGILYIYSSRMPVLKALTAVIDPGDEEYVFDESALGLIPGRVSENTLKYE